MSAAQVIILLVWVAGVAGAASEWRESRIVASSILAFFACFGVASVVAVAACISYEMFVGAVR